MAEAPIPPGFELVDSSPTAPHSEANVPAGFAPAGEQPIPEGFVPEEDYFNTPGQQIKAGIEGLGRGLVGPLAPMAEKALGVNPEDINARREHNPWTSGVGEAVGLVAPALMSAGISAAGRGALSAGSAAARAAGEHIPEAASLAQKALQYGTLGGLLETAGSAATKAVGLGELGADAGRLAKVGSSIVRNAAEMAAFQAADETSKMVTQDKDAPLSIESALSNIGLAAALGGAAGGLWTGAVSPLWKATVGPKTAELLGAVKTHLNDDSALEAAKNLSGITPIVAGEDNILRSAVKAAPDNRIRAVADEYAKENGLKLNHELPKVKPDPDRAAAIAKAFEDMPHAPNDPEVKQAYKSLVDETMKQWDAIQKTGLKVEAIPPGAPNPYKNSVDMMKDVRENNHMWYFPSEQGFGQEAINQHPLLDMKGTINGQSVPANDIFRIVHDYFGHAKEGFGFGPSGEENAWLHHMQMYGPDAQKALTSETRGQNSWVNYGPKGLENRTNPGNTQYAEQKAGVLPEWTRATESGVGTADQQSFSSLKDPNNPLNKALQDLGVDVAPVMKAALSGDPKAIQIFNELREAQHPEILAHLKAFPEKVEAAVLEKSGISLADMAHFSEAETGHEVFKSFEKEYSQKYEPIAKMLEERNKIASDLSVPDEVRRDFGGRIMERGIKDVETDSPYYKIYSDYAQRVMAKDKIGGLDKLRTELFNLARGTQDYNAKNAYYGVRDMINEFIENQIEKQGVMINKEGVQSAADIIAQRMAANKLYRGFSRMSGELADHLGVGNFRGAGTLKEKLEGLSPEQLLRKFSPKGNVDSIPFLQKYFPETLKTLQQVETKKFMASAIKSEQGAPYLDIKALNNKINKIKAGSPEYANFVLSPQTQQQIQSAQTIMDAIPQIKSSGTAGWISKLTKHLPASALSAVGFMMGHNPISSYLLGEMAQRLGKDVPEAMKLSYLKFLGSDKAVSAPGFKAMSDAIEAGIKGHKKMVMATNTVLTPGSRVLLGSQLPTAVERVKLDKLVAQNQENPNDMIKYADSDLGHYMPNHQVALTTATTRQLQYLASLKPQPIRTGPLNEPLPPPATQQARYNKALDIANNPLIVLEKIKDGSLQASDIQDMQNLYPSMYKDISARLTDGIASYQAAEKNIPYKTKMGLSLFLGTPLDSTMQPANIAQIQQGFIKPAQGPGSPMQARHSTAKMGKQNASYRTISQDAERDRSGRK